MPIHYDIETDYLYQQGFKRGFELGLQMAINKYKREVIIRMLQMGKFTLYEITIILGVTEEFVLNIAREHQLNIPD